MNLEKLGVQELNANETLSIDGGFFEPLGFAAAVVAATAAYVKAVDLLYEAGIEIGKEVAEAALN